MAYSDLRDWIRQLDKAGELRRIREMVSPYLEMAEIADRAAKLGKGTANAGGPALLFENVTGFPGAKVLMNQFGSERRMRLALEVESSPTANSTSFPRPASTDVSTVSSSRDSPPTTASASHLPV